MEEWLLRRNKKHHQQVWEDESVPTQAPIYDLLTQEEKIEKLLKGEIDIERLEVKEHVKEWLHWIKKTPKEREIRAMPPIITLEDFREVFEAVDEMTSSLPLGLHYTLWKALADTMNCAKCAQQ